jgi:hypothetical protein
VTAVDVTQILMGPCDMYVGTFGATEPTSSDWTTAIDTGIWVPGGATSGGIKLAVAIDTKTLEVDQVPEEVGVRVTGRKLSVETEMAESTLENLKFLMNGGTIATGGIAIGVGTATIVASTGVFTTPASHGLVVGDKVSVATVVTTSGLTAGTVYYVRTAPSGTTFTLSATSGGAALTLTTDGSVTGLTKVNYKQFEPLSSVAAFDPTYSAILLEGAAPGGVTGRKRRVYVRKVLSTGGFEMEWKKDAQQGLKVKFGAYYVTDAVKPFRIIDQIG